MDALCELGTDLVPGVTVRTSAIQADETFAFGAAPAQHASAVRVGVSDVGAELERGATAASCVGELPFGGFAAGAAITAMALEAALPRIENATGLTARSPRPSAGPPVRIHLEDLFPELARAMSTDLGWVDAISGGAITHALLFCMLRIPGLRARLETARTPYAGVPLGVRPGSTFKSFSSSLGGASSAPASLRSVLSRTSRTPRSTRDTSVAASRRVRLPVAATGRVLAAPAAPSVRSPERRDPPGLVWLWAGPGNPNSKG